MAVKQPGPARRAAGRPAPSPGTEVERVSRLLEEYGKKWRELGKYGGLWGWDVEGAPPLRFARLLASPEGAEMHLAYRDGRTEDVRLIPPEDAKKAAEELVRMEREHGLISRFLEKYWSAWLFTELEALRRYGPLFDEGCNIPELRPGTGDVYRDFLELLLAARALSKIPWSMRSGTAVYWAPRLKRKTRARITVPVEPPVPLPHAERGEGGRGIAAVEVRMMNDIELVLRDGRGGPIYSTASPYDREAESYYLSVLNASLLMLFEREGGLLTKATEALEERLRALERALKDLAVAAEAAILLFG